MRLLSKFLYRRKNGNILLFIDKSQKRFSFNYGLNIFYKRFLTENGYKGNYNKFGSLC